MKILIEEINKILFAISGLIYYKKLRENELLIHIRSFLLTCISISENDSSDLEKAGLIEEYTEMFASVLVCNHSGDPDFSKLFLQLMEQDENPFSRFAATRNHGKEDLSEAQREIILNDLDKCRLILSFSSEILTRYIREITGCSLPNWKNEIHFDSNFELFEHLWKIYKNHGFGIFSNHHAFIWKSNHLETVRNPDPIKREQLFSYEYELERIEENTKRLIAGKRGENLLLFGARGTGKSSIVKAMANDYFSSGLRLIEINKDDLLTISDLLEFLTDFDNTKYSFLLFLDDLTFSEEDIRYTALKTVLEGGLKTRPVNTAIYATSNRRHIVVEKKAQDLYENDSRNERLSLSDRFGIAIRFASPTQTQYLDIVSGILSYRKVPFDFEKLQKEATAWAMKENGFSPRTARQFCDYYQGETTFSDDTKINTRES